MTKFIIIPIDDNEESEMQAQHIRNVADRVDDGFICDLDKHTRFDAVTTMNHLELSDVVKEIKKVDE